MNKVKQKSKGIQKEDFASDISTIPDAKAQDGVKIEQVSRAENEKESEKHISDNGSFKKRIKRGSWILLGVAVAGIVLYSKLSTSTSVVQSSSEVDAAIETHISTALGAGTRLLSSDQTVIGQDYTITHDSDDEDTVIWIWDYAAEDGDYVQILVDGVAICDPFMIKNKAVSYTVPAVGEVQVVGTRDGGGGITYGVYYELNQTSYFNGMDEGDGNIYTLVRE